VSTPTIRPITKTPREDKRARVYRCCASTVEPYALERVCEGPSPPIAKKGSARQEYK
jgi:hypothetical protein